MRDGDVVALKDADWPLRHKGELADPASVTGAKHPRWLLVRSSNPGFGARERVPPCLARRLDRRLDDGTATKKNTITLEAEQYDAIRSLVEARSTKSVSAFVQHTVGVSLSDVAGWGALLAEALEQTGGPSTKAERHWADGVLSARSGKSAKRRANTKSRAT